MASHLEHAEHVAHAGHGHGHDHGPEGTQQLGTYIGITMATLGVLLAFCAAKVGGERTELVQALVEQQHAHAKYQAQNIKHRVAINNLRQMHAEVPKAEMIELLDTELKKIDDEAAAKPEGGAQPAAVTKAARVVGRSTLEARAPRRSDALFLADTVERYEKEGEAAERWVEAYDGAIHAHGEAQERYELAQLFAEIGIVVASVALLLKRRVAWLLSIGLGIASIAYVGTTYARTSHELHEAEQKIEETGKEYREHRTADRTTQADHELVEGIRRWAGKPAAAPAPATAPAHEHGGEHH